jgi:hypothetical protein
MVILDVGNREEIAIPTNRPGIPKSKPRPRKYATAGTRIKFIKNASESNFFSWIC